MKAAKFCRFDLIECIDCLTVPSYPYFFEGRLMAKTAPVLLLKTETPGRELSFYKFEEIEAFATEEIQHWSWLAEPNLANRIPNNPWGTIRNQWSHFRSQLPGYSGMQAGFEETINNIFRQHIVDQRIPLKSSMRARTLDEMRLRDPFQAGIALAGSMNVLPNVGNFEHFKYVSELAIAEYGISASATAAAKKELESALVKQSKAFQKVVQDTADQQHEFENNQAYHRKSISVLSRYLQRRSLQYRLKKDKEFNEAIQKFQSTEALYKEHMRLKGPVEYWSKKAKDHVEKARDYRWYLSWFAVIGAVVLVGGLYLLSDHAIEVASNDKPSAIYLILATLGIVFSTIIFWIARVLTRLFLSEHHLAIDSEERSVMALTYLALTAEGKISESERILVLASLFRPTADGIVKDDAAPDISPSSMISKVLSK
jgi:Family of unknown function (DUF6161)